MKGKNTRLTEHANLLKDYLRTTFAKHGEVVNEFIKQIDPEYDPTSWQRFTTVEEVHTEFSLYLNPAGTPSAVVLSTNAPEKLVQALHNLFTSTPETFEVNFNQYKILFTLEAQALKKKLGLN